MEKLIKDLLILSNIDREMEDLKKETSLKKRITIMKTILELFGETEKETQEKFKKTIMGVKELLKTTEELMELLGTFPLYEFSMN